MQRFKLNDPTQILGQSHELAHPVERKVHFVVLEELHYWLLVQNSEAAFVPEF